MYQKEYKDMNDRIGPDGSLNARVMERAQPRRRSTFRPAAAVAALLLIALVATPVMAECVPWVLERIAPELTRRLQPVQRSDTNNGITMEVVGASVKGNQAELVVKLEGRDLAEANLVMPFLHTDMDGLESGRFSPMNYYEGAEEDHEKGIFYYRIEMLYEKGIRLQEILEGKMTVSLTEVEIIDYSPDEIEIPIILTDLVDLTLIDVSTMEDFGLKSNGWQEAGEFYHGPKEGQYIMLPCVEPLYNISEDLALTNMAYIDGKLHIQTAKTKMTDGDTSWTYWGPYLRYGGDADFTRPEYGIHFTRTGDEQVDYREYVFDVRIDILYGFTMVIQKEYHKSIPVDCKVTFQFTEDEVLAE